MGDLPDARMRRCGTRHGYDFSTRARQLTSNDFARFDYIIAYNEIDLVLLFTDPNTTDPWDDSQMIETIRHCDKQNVPIATNLASAEMLIMGLQRGDLDWREMLHSKNRF